MAFNGSGTFTVDTSGTPVVTNTVIDSVMFNALLTELEVALSTCLTKDGQTTATQSVPFAAGISVTGSALLNSGVRLNDSGGDNDVVIESDTNTGHFTSDAGAFSGVGSFGFGAVTTEAFVNINPPALTAGANEAFYRLNVLTANAVTVPAGTAPVVASFAVREPNITATGTVTIAATVYVASAPTEGVSNFALLVESGATQFKGSVEMEDARFLLEQGSAIASANDLTLASDGNAFALTGTTQINRIATAGWKNGSIVVLLFDTSITVAHGQASGGGFGGLLLNGAGNFSATANDTLTLMLDGAGSWREIARSAN